MDINVASIPPKTLAKMPRRMLDGMTRYERRGRVETHTRFLPDGSPSPVQPNRIDPLNDIDFEVVKTLPSDDLDLRFQQYCYYFAYHLGLMTRDAISEALDVEEFRWLFKALKITRSGDAEDYFIPSRTRQRNLAVGRDRFLKFARKYHVWLSEHSEATPTVVRQEQAFALERILKILQAKLEADGVESVSVPDIIALMKRQAALHGLDSPRRTESTQTRVNINSEDMAAAFFEAREFENQLEGGAEWIVDEDEFDEEEPDE